MRGEAVPRRLGAAVSGGGGWCWQEGTLNTIVGSEGWLGEGGAAWACGGRPGVTASGAGLSWNMINSLTPLRPSARKRTHPEPTSPLETFSQPPLPPPKQTQRTAQPSPAGHREAPEEPQAIQSSGRRSRGHQGEKLETPLSHTLEKADKKSEEPAPPEGRPGNT